MLKRLLLLNQLHTIVTGISCTHRVGGSDTAVAGGNVWDDGCPVSVPKHLLILELVDMVADSGPGQDGSSLDHVDRLDNGRWHYLGGAAYHDLEAISCAQGRDAVIG